MQAYLQYRRIRQAVRRQTELEHDKSARTSPGTIVEESKDQYARPVSPHPAQEDRELQTTTTRHSQRTAIGEALSGIHVRDRTTHEGKAGKVFVVDWDGDQDPLNPRNYSHAYRISITLMVSSIAFAVGAASSIDSAIIPQAAAEFDVSEVAESLCVGIFLIGFGCGAFFAGPFSEVLGRNIVYVSTLIIYMIWIMASALSPNIGAQVVFRFLAGFFGSTPLTCAGGSISDLWDPLEKTYSFPLFAIAGFAGPVLGPVMGSYIGIGGLPSWRWTEWIILIMSGLVLGLIVLCMPETYAPVLLEWKAAHLREATGDSRFMSALEITKPPLWENLQRAVYRPFVLTASEPIIVLITLYMTTLYVVVFTFLVGYPFIFTEVYGTSQGLTFVLFAAIMVGILLGGLLIPLVYWLTKRENIRSKEKGQPHMRAEVRLWFAMLGAPAVPISLFWMGWTDYESISIWSPIIASALFGYGVICIFISSYMYIIDSYEVYAASALTFLTVVRYIAAGGMTVAGIPFYRNMGTHWTLTILGGLSTLMVPIPYVFYHYGHVIRRRSKYAATGS